VKHRLASGLALGAALLVSAACADAGAANADTAGDVAMALADAPQASISGLPLALVYKTPSCGCCNGWIEHLEAAGFEVDARNIRDLMSIKRDAGVPVQLSSCHTALIDGYVVEGHVPIEQVQRMLAERPDIAGIAVPGMPTGSPGMEGANGKPYQVFSFDNAGHAAVYAEIDPR
jgi:hypothetical protein